MEAIQTGRAAPPALSDESVNSPDDIADTGDLGAEIAAIAVRNGDVERDASHEAREAEERTEAKDDAAQVQDMREEASSMRMEGVFDAVTTVGTAYVKAYCPSAAFAGEAAEKLGDGFWHAAQHANEAEAAGQKAAADQAKGAAQDDGDAANDANGYVKAAIDFYREYASTEAQTQSAAIHRA